MDINVTKKLQTNKTPQKTKAKQLREESTDLYYLAIPVQQGDLLCFHVVMTKLLEGSFLLYIVAQQIWMSGLKEFGNLQVLVITDNWKH